MKITLLILSLMISFNLNAKEHSLHAHVHGAIKVGMAVDKNVIEIDIDGPAESFLGFEYLPKTAKEKKLFSDLKDKWIKNLELFFTFDPKLKCLTEAAHFEQIKTSGSHSEIEATAKVRCVSDVAGTEGKVMLRKEFKNIKKLEVVVVSKTTTSVAITALSQVIKL